ncbi:hypothetical protein O4H49_07660 [Kiloniella laminariae]|uniref:Integron gene cassette protein n=1 Tax=Kiloniella laminariae TaxID=454162 RepID=A0ABT4LI90_9PROT|nr:hypothetical protein [Kiloniella laminariae]MCZ4280650.1 hypothetical protein [Kiloniella laminariae]
MKVESRNIWQDGRKIKLHAVLEELSENFSCDSYLWSLLYFDGKGSPPANLSVPDLEDVVRSNPKGYLFSWAEVCDFAATLYDTNDCLIVAVKEEASLVKAELDKDDFSRCEIVIDYHDSTILTLLMKDEATLPESSV